ncbi:MAG TPA: hypothetical protein VM532_16445 [Burkholderiales bacterium]|jgi:EAL domain-containing protein (putative c-di-GMP-specific phosphodiesterase class I)|nr:hypothetical protein [Burkholderiales bacterium]
MPRIAEGVETSRQASFLMEHDCSCAQGFYYSVAVPPEILTDFLNKPIGYMLAFAKRS